MNMEEAKNALGEYLENISPMPNKDNEWVDVVEHYAPLIEEKLTEERLQTLNKKDKKFILVVWGDRINKHNHFITSQFENGFVFTTSPSKNYFRWMELHGKEESIRILKGEIKSWDESADKTIGQMLNEVFPPIAYDYYLLTEATTPRTLNFSRSGFL